MKKFFDVLRNLIFIIGIPGSIGGAIKYYKTNIDISILLIFLFIFLIILYFYFLITTRTSALLYYIRLFIGKPGYVVEEKKTKMKYENNTKDVVFSVRNNIKSNIDYTTQIIEKFTARQYANENFVNRVTFITEGNSIARVWEEHGVIYYLLNLKAPLLHRKTDEVKYQFPVSNPNQIVGTYITEIPVKKIVLGVSSSGSLKFSKAIYKVTGAGGTDNVLVEKEVKIDPNNPRTVTKAVSFPLRGYRYSLEYFFDNSSEMD